LAEAFGFQYRQIKLTWQARKGRMELKSIECGGEYTEEYHSLRTYICSVYKLIFILVKSSAKRHNTPSFDQSHFSREKKARYAYAPFRHGTLLGTCHHLRPLLRDSHCGRGSDVEEPGGVISLSD